MVSHSHPSRPLKEGPRHKGKMSFDLKIQQGDIKIGTDGDFQKVEDNEKLIQDIAKIATTPLGGNPFFPWYGSPVSKTLIGSPFNFDMIGTLASAQLRQSLETLQLLQQTQVKVGQRVSPGELLAAIQDLRIERNQVDPRYFSVSIKVLTKALTVVTTGFTTDPL